MKFLLTLTLVFLLSLSANATTYYISKASGNNSNNGLTKLLAWSDDPYSPAFTGTYVHSAGDVFIFEAGNTWPSSEFPIIDADSGASASVPDQRMVDPTWFSGGSFSPPIFDNQLADVASYSGHAMLKFTGSFQTVNGIIFTNAAYNSLHFDTSGINIGAGQYVVVTNCAFGNIINNVTPLTGSDAFTWIQGSTSGSVGTKTTHCYFTCLPSTAYVGLAVNYCDTFEYNTVEYIPNAFIGICTVCQNNTIRFIQHSEDTSVHENCLEIFIPPGNSYIRNNIVTNNAAGELMDISALDITSNDVATVYVYNNLIANNFGTLTPAMQFDGSAPNSGHYGYRGNGIAWNNTIQDAEPSGQSQGYIRVVGRTGSQFATIIAQNNHFITEGSGLVQADAGFLGTITENHELVENNSTANAAGYTQANSWMPTALNSPTVGIGSTAPSSIFTSSLNGVVRGFLWDIGAYQIAGSGGPSGSIFFGGQTIINFGGNTAITP